MSTQEQNTPKPQYWFPEDTARFEAWLNEWNHQLGSGRWSIYTFAKAAFKAGTVYERKKQASLNTPNQ